MKKALSIMCAAIMMAFQPEVTIAAPMEDGVSAAMRGDLLVAANIWWQRAIAEFDNQSAQFTLGELYANGDGVPKDDEEAIRWFRKAFDQEDSPIIADVVVPNRFIRSISIERIDSAKHLLLTAHLNHGKPAIIGDVQNLSKTGESALTRRISTDNRSKNPPALEKLKVFYQDGLSKWLLLAFFFIGLFLVLLFLILTDSKKRRTQRSR